MTDKSNYFKDLPLTDKVAQFDKFAPDFLTQHKCWGLWEFGPWNEKKRKWDKVNVAGFDNDKPENFLHFDDALDRLEAGDGDGLSICMAAVPHLVCVDFDGAADDEDFSQMCAAADNFGWWEISASGDGVHAFVEDAEWGNRGRQRPVPKLGRFKVDLLADKALIFMTCDCEDDVSNVLLHDADTWEYIKDCCGKKKRERQIAVAGEKYPDTRPDVVQSLLDTIDLDAKFTPEGVAPSDLDETYGESREFWLIMIGVLKRWGESDHFATPELAFEMFDEWCSRSPKYDAEDCIDKWGSFDTSVAGVSLGSLMFHAKRFGWSRRDARQIVSQERKVSMPVVAQIRDHITDRLIDLGFHEDALPVNWGCIESAEPSCIVDTAGRKQVISSNGAQVFIGAETGSEVLRQAFGSFVNTTRVREFVDEMIAAEDERFSTDAKVKAFFKSVSGVVHTSFWAAIALGKTVSGMNVQIDMFTPNVVPHIRNGECTFTMPYEPMAAWGEDDWRDDVIADYKDHNPMFDDIITFIVMSRFAFNRKNCFLWIKASSNWGKGFLFDPQGVFGGLGLCASVSVKEIEMCLEGKPVGINPNLLISQWVLHVDEFKTVKAELKMLENRLTASPKNQLRFNAPLFAKVFTSAENVASLVGETGVEEQFAKRFSYIEATGDLTSRQEKLGVGQRAYTLACRAYAQSKIEEMISEMLELGPDGACIRAEKWLAEWHKRHGLGVKFGSLADSVDEIVEDLAGMIERFCSGFIKGLGDPRDPAVYKKTMRGIPERIVKCIAERSELVKYHGDDVPLVNKLLQIVEAYIEEMFGVSEKGKIRFKKHDIKTALDARLFPERTSDVTKILTMEGVKKVSRGTVTTRVFRDET